MMRFTGGYTISPWAIFLALNGVVVAIMLFRWSSDSAFERFRLFLGLEGTVMWASALSPAGGAPPPQHGGLRAKLTWFFRDYMQGAGTVEFSPALFYFGLLVLLVAMGLG